MTKLIRHAFLLQKFLHHL